MPVPSPVIAALESLDPDRLAAALAEGGCANTPVQAPGMAQPQSPLVFLLRSSLIEQEPALDLLRVLLEHGAQAVPSGTDVPPMGQHPLALALASRNPGAFAVVWRHLDAPQRALLARPVTRMGHSMSLLDLALAAGDPHAAGQLWDQAGIAPQPAGRCPWALAHPSPRPDTHGHRLSTLEWAVRPSTDSTASTALVLRMLDLPWPQADLDASLRQAVSRRAPLEVVARLLELGACPRVNPDLDEYGLPVLAHALASIPDPPMPGVIARLVAAGADPHASVSFSLSVGGAASWVRPPGQHPDHSPPDIQEATPLGLAAYQGYACAVMELLETGASADHRTAQGHTPLHLACMSAASARPSMPAIVSLLLAAGAPVGAVDATGRTALEHWLAARPKAWACHPIPVPQDEAPARALMLATLAARPDLAPGLQAVLAEAGLDPADPLGRIWRATLSAFLASAALDRSLPARVSCAASRRM